MFYEVEIGDGEDTLRRYAVDTSTPERAKEIALAQLPEWRVSIVRLPIIRLEELIDYDDVILDTQA